MKWCHFIMRNILWNTEQHLNIFNCQIQTKTGSLFPIISCTLFKSNPQNDSHHFFKFFFWPVTSWNWALTALRPSSHTECVSELRALQLQRFFFLVEKKRIFFAQINQRPQRIQVSFLLDSVITSEILSSISEHLSQRCTFYFFIFLKTLNRRISQGSLLALINHFFSFLFISLGISF